LTETKTLEEALAEAFTRADSLDAPLEPPAVIVDDANQVHA